MTNNPIRYFFNLLVFSFFNRVFLFSSLANSLLSFFVKTNSDSVELFPSETSSIMGIFYIKEPSRCIPRMVYLEIYFIKLQDYSQKKKHQDTSQNINFDLVVIHFYGNISEPGSNVTPIHKVAQLLDQQMKRKCQNQTPSEKTSA